MITPLNYVAVNLDKYTWAVSDARLPEVLAVLSVAGEPCSSEAAALAEEYASEGEQMLAKLRLTPSFMAAATAAADCNEPKDAAQAAFNVALNELTLLGAEEAARELNNMECVTERLIRYGSAFLILVRAEMDKRGVEDAAKDSPTA